MCICVCIICIHIYMYIYICFLYGEGPITCSGRPPSYDTVSGLSLCLAPCPSMCFRHVCGLEYPSVGL